MDEEKIKQKIIDTVKKFSGKKFRRRELYNLVKEKGVEYGAFKEILTSLENTGEISRLKGRKFALPEEKILTTGIFKASKDGGKVSLPGGDTVVISRFKTKNALSGDTVQIKLLKRRIDLASAGEVISIVKRSSKPIVGIFKKHGKTAFIEPTQERFAKNIHVNNSDKFDVHNGDLVVGRIEMPVDGETLPYGEITSVLGNPDAPGVDVLAVALRYELPVEFPAGVIAESEKVPADLTQKIISARRDIRNVVTFTIDPEDAKDFDDAISISKDSKGFYELGVHIADVAHYIPDGSVMDTEAKTRAMSCYLVDRVLPMLPHRLSDDLCSLKPREDKLTKSVFARISPDGDIVKSEITNTVISSDARLTYEQVQNYLDGKDSGGNGKIAGDVGKALKLLSELSDVLIKRREERGALDLDLPEVKVVLDSDGKPVDIIKYNRYKSNRMIEEVMLLANTVTAVALTEKNVPFLYRVHDKPDELKLTAFSEIAQKLGYEFNPHKAHKEKYIQTFLNSIRGRQNERILNQLILRAMKKAGYSPKNIGH